MIISIRLLSLKLTVDERKLVHVCSANFLDLSNFNSISFHVLKIKTQGQSFHRQWDLC
jgi:hypothetical protein